MAKSKDKTPEPVNAYATHMDTLRRVLDIVKPKKVLEFGPGNFSTQLWVDAGCKVTAIEQQHAEWAKAIAKHYEKTEAIDIFWYPGPVDALEVLGKENKRYDIVFVDGHILGRYLAINAAQKWTDTIIAHDTESRLYQWEKVTLSADWHQFDFKALTPWTTVWTKDEKLTNALAGQEE